MRWLVNKWWSLAGPQALAKAKIIGKHTDEESDEVEALDVALSDFAYVATEPAFAARVNSTAAAVDKHSAAQLQRIGIKLSKADPGVSKLVPGFRKQNVALVKTMFEREKSKLEQLLADGAGRRVESLAADIAERFEITTRHAELIARDQCLKLNANISHERMQNAGITKFVWTTAGDERVRPEHDDLDGETFSFDDPPVTNSDGDTNLPGEDFQCRCVAFPVDDILDDDSADDDAAE